MRSGNEVGQDLVRASGRMQAIESLADWAATPLGPVDVWPTRLKLLSRMVRASRFPMIVLWGPQLVQLYNDEYRRIFMGAKHPAGMGQPTAQCWPEVWHLNEPIYRRVWQGEAVYIEDQEYALYPSGARKVFYLTASFDPVEDDDGGIEGILVTLQDTTSRVIAERENTRLLLEAQDSARTLQQWFDQAPGFIALLRGPQMVFEMVNGAYWQLVGHHRELLGRPLFEALADVREQGFEELLSQVYSTGKAYVGRSARIMLRREPGARPTEHFLDFVYQPVVDHGGAVTGIFVQGHDVTEQHRAVLGLREADRHKDEFLATLAHELRNPLAPIRQAVQLAQAPRVDEARKRWALGVIDRQAQHMSVLLDDLLDVARISRGHLELRRQAMELDAVVSAAVETARPLMEAKRHRLEVNLPEQPVTLDADPVRISQVVSNLLTNAAKYTDPGGLIVLGAELQPQDGFVRITVRDNGVGLAPGSLEKVFGMFAQVKSALDRSEGGLGIGLALSRGLAQLHGGSLHATSEGLGKGTEFVLRLPFVSTSLQAAAVEAGAPASTSPGRRLLLVDDNRDAVESLGALLEIQGHQVNVAHSGADALEVARSIQPELAVIDIGMPGMSGYEVAQSLRGTDWGRSMVLIALTGWGQRQDKQRALDAGFDFHLTKPVELDALNQLLERGGGAASTPQAVQV